MNRISNMEKNPYRGRLAAWAWVGILGGIALAIVSNLIDTTGHTFLSIDQTALFWKLATGAFADVAIGLGITAAIGAAVIAGVEWRLAKNEQQRIADVRAAARAAQKK